MLITFLTTDSHTLTLPLPDDYVGTELEIIVQPTTAASRRAKTPVFGCAKGQFHATADFDEPLADFGEYQTP
ncbi:MAG: DUF2281 domain-containing protein [Verrucomicrobiales bacterium]|jgi:hypothetical protein|nr:DUF2281 domain-containing protein [Verrucomicrobiales bacterium]